MGGGSGAGNFTFHLAALSVGSTGGGFLCVFCMPFVWVLSVLAVAAFARIEGSTTQRTGFVIGHCIHPFFCLNQRRISSSQKFHHSLLSQSFGLVCVLPLIWGVLSAPMSGGTHIHTYFLIFNTVFATLILPVGKTFNFCFCDPCALILHATMKQLHFLS